MAERIVAELVDWWTTREAHSAPSLRFFSSPTMPHHRDLQQHLDELQGYLEVLLALDRRRLTVEIGLYRGGTHFAWSRLFDQVISIDCDYWTCCKRVIEFPAASSLVLYGNSNDPGTVALLQTLLDGRSADHLFLDGDHAYDAVRADFLTYEPIVRSGGIIGFHDAFLADNGVNPFLCDLSVGHVAGYPPTALRHINLHPGDHAMGISYFYKQ